MLIIDCCLLLVVTTVVVSVVTLVVVTTVDMGRLCTFLRSQMTVCVRVNVNTQIRFSCTLKLLIKIKSEHCLLVLLVVFLIRYIIIFKFCPFIFNIFIFNAFNPSLSTFKIFMLFFLQISSALFPGNTSYITKLSSSPKMKNFEIPKAIFVAFI